MTNQITVYASLKDSIKPYEPSPAQLQRISSQKRLIPGTLKYELVDFFRIGFGLPSLDDIVESN